MALQDIVHQLEEVLPALRARHEVDDFAADIFEAVDDLLDLGHRLVAADTRTNYPVRVRQEQELWEGLKRRLSDRAGEQAFRYQPIIELAEQLLAIAEGVRPSKEGHLGFLTIVREQFAFLRADYGFAIVNEEPVKIRFASGEIYVQVAWARSVSSSCTFGCESNRDRSFWIDDLLYLYGDKRYKSLPDELVLDSQNTITQWVAFLASIFRQYGHDILRSRAGIFDELVAAQEARDREYAEEMDRRYRGGSCTG
jgi:hypothetical protein